MQNICSHKSKVRRTEVGLWPTKHSASNMVSRQVQRRLLSLFASARRPTSSNSTAGEYFTQFPNSSSSQKYGLSLWTRRFQAMAEANRPNIKSEGEQEGIDIDQDSSSISCPDPGAAVASPVNNESTLKNKQASDLKISPRHDTAMMFTCKVCETRSLKMISRESYEKGVVVARCGGCDNIHLIADRLGWFGDPSSVEDFLAARGEEVKKGSMDTINLTLQDIAGKKNLEV